MNLALTNALGFWQQYYIKQEGKSIFMHFEKDVLCILVQNPDLPKRCFLQLLKFPQC